MNPDPHFHPDVYPTVDGERSTAGSNYGDWRPAETPRPHGYDYESRFEAPPEDPDFRRLREEHEGRLDAQYPQWRPTTYRVQRFIDEFGRWHQEPVATGRHFRTGPASVPR